MRREPAKVRRSATYTFKSARLLRSRPQVKYGFIAKYRRIWPTRTMCHLLGVSTRGFYDWLDRPMNQHERANAQLLQAIISENKDTGLSLPDIPGTVAFIRLGNAVSLLGQLPWVQELPVLYWGDVDTYGFSILAQARKTLGNVRSMMMDLETLELHRDRVVDERQQATNVDHALLTTQELATYEGLLNGKWWTQKRLEQERIDWPYAVSKILATSAR